MDGLFVLQDLKPSNIAVNEDVMLKVSLHCECFWCRCWLNGSRWMCLLQGSDLRSLDFIEILSSMCTVRIHRYRYHDLAYHVESI